MEMSGDCDEDEDCDGDLLCGTNNCGQDDRTGEENHENVGENYTIYAYMLFIRLLGLLLQETLLIKHSLLRFWNGSSPFHHI